MEILGRIGQQGAGATSLGEGLEVARGPGSGQGQEGPGLRGTPARAPGLARCPPQRPPAAPWNFRAAAASASRGAGAATKRRTARTAATSAAAGGPAGATTRPAPAARTACPTAPTPRTRARTPAVSARRASPCSPPPAPATFALRAGVAGQLESDLGLGHRPPLTFFVKLSLKTRALHPGPG